MTRPTSRPAAPRYRRVAVRTWSDPWFLALSPMKPCGQALWLALATNPSTCALPGVVLAGVATIAEVLRWPVAATRRALDELVRAGAAFADLEARVVFLPHAVEASPPDNPNVARGWARALLDVPACAVRDEVARRLRDVVAAQGSAWLQAFDAESTAPVAAEPTPNPLGNPSPNPSGKGADRGAVADGGEEGARNPSGPAAPGPLPLTAFPEPDRPVVEAIRSVALPAWRDDPAVTPPAIAALRALAPGLDLVAAVRRCAAWWTTSPAKVRGRRSCLATLRTWVQRDADDPRHRTASPDGAALRADAADDPFAAEKADADYARARSARAGA